MKYIKKIYEYIHGKRMPTYMENDIEILIDEMMFILIVSSIVTLSIFLLQLDATK